MCVLGIVLWNWKATLLGRYVFLHISSWENRSAEVNVAVSIIAEPVLTHGSCNYKAHSPSTVLHCSDLIHWDNGMSGGDDSIFEKVGDGFPLQSGLTLRDDSFPTMKGMTLVRNCRNQLVALTCLRYGGHHSFKNVWPPDTCRWLIDRGVQMGRQKLLIWMWLGLSDKKKSKLGKQKADVSLCNGKITILYPVTRSKPLYWPKTHWLKILLEGNFQNHEYIW